ncbi:MAG: hypothetical protein EXS30_11530 [Pedosphaera sp.]|nr:hypothetical protein [Pedosphaera sp.]
MPNLLGQIPLEYPDFVVDPKKKRLIPNPKHGDNQMTEEYLSVHDLRAADFEHRFYRVKS